MDNTINILVLIGTIEYNAKQLLRIYKYSGKELYVAPCRAGHAQSYGRPLKRM